MFKIFHILIFFLFIYFVKSEYNLQWERINKFNINNQNNNNIINKILYNNETNSIIVYNNNNEIFINNNITSTLNPIYTEKLNTTISIINYCTIFNNTLYINGKIQESDESYSLELIKLNNSGRNSNIGIGNNNFKLFKNIQRFSFNSFKLIDIENIIYIEDDSQITIFNLLLNQIKLTFGKEILVKSGPKQVELDYDSKLALVLNQDSSIKIFNITNGNFIGDIILYEDLDNTIMNEMNEIISIEFNDMDDILLINNGEIINIFKKSITNNEISFRKLYSYILLDSSSSSSSSSTSSSSSLDNNNNNLIIYKNNNEIIINNNFKIKIFKWNGIVINNINYNEGLIEIIGNNLKNISNIYFQNDKDNECIDIYIEESGNFISCNYSKIKSTLKSNKFYELIVLDLNQKNKEIINYSFGKFKYIDDGCQDGYWYDKLSNICKRLKFNNIIITKCILNNVVISKIGNCPKFWKPLSRKVESLRINQIFRFQNCLTNNLKMVSEIDLVNSRDLNKISNTTQCKYFIEKPTFIDISKVLTIYHFNCFDIYGTKSIIQRNTPIIPNECNLTTTTTGNLDIFVNKIDIWSIGKRCLNGIRIIKNNISICQCNKDWIGQQCDIHICLEGFKLNNETGQCECKRECNELSNQILDPTTCLCICNLSNPIRCSNGLCSNSIKSCLDNYQNTECNSNKPFKCLNGKCYSSPNDCKNNIPECILNDCCWNGLLLNSKKHQECPILPSCPKEYPYRCIDGSCKLSIKQCSTKQLLLLNHCNSTQVCPDGSCPPCFNYDGCPLTLPIQCLNGECTKLNSSNCKYGIIDRITTTTTDLFSDIIEPINYLKSEQLELFYPLSNQIENNNLLPIYIKPISTTLTIQFNKTSHINIYSSINKDLIGKIDINILSSKNYFNNSGSEYFNKTQILVRPVADSYLRQIRFSNTNLTRSNAIYSSVLNITVPILKKDQSLPFLTNITLKIINNLNISINKSNLNNFCLGFINTTLNQWECVKINNQISNLIIINNDDKELMVMGKTNHFTCFGVLLRGNNNFFYNNNNSYKYHGNIDNNKNNQYNSSGGFKIPIRILVGSIIAVIVFVVLCIFIILIIVSHKKHGNFKTMKNIYLERLKYRFKNNNQQTNNQTNNNQQNNNQINNNQQNINNIEKQKTK